MITFLKKNSGFTLIELLVVITIIGVLAVIGVSSFQTASKSGRDGKRKGDLSQTRAALEFYRSQTGSYPPAGSFPNTVSVLKNAGYMTEPLPVDPKNAAPYQYSYSVSGATFCICAQLENGGTGNSTGSCAGTSGNFYCLTQP